MKTIVARNLAFGNESICTHATSGAIADVHACKEPCHRAAVGYRGRRLASCHPHYLVLRREFHLYLNLIDPPQPLFTRVSFEAFMTFVDEHLPRREVLIHCNRGESRAPSLALLYMAKRLSMLPADSYATAAALFRQQFAYNPGAGIALWLTQNWGAIA